MNIDWNAAAVIAHGDGTINVHGHVNFVAKPGEMFMPGRFLTASRPSSLSICAASYFWLVSIPVGRADEIDFTGKSSSVLGIEDGRATTDKYGSGKRARHNKYLG